MIAQFIHLILLCYGCGEFAGYCSNMPHTAAALWLFFSLLILFVWLPAYREKIYETGKIPGFFKLYNIFCFIIVCWISVFFIFVNPISAFNGTILADYSTTLNIVLAMFLYLLLLKPFMLAIYDIMQPLLSEEETKEDFYRARLTVPIIFFPPVLFWIILEDLGLSKGMELMSEIKTLTLAPFFLFGLYVLSPRLFNWAWKTENANEELCQRISEISEKAQTKIAGVKIWNTFKEPLPNAAVAGLLSKFRFVYITDFLLDVFTNNQIEAVVGHELGHLRLGHVLSYLLFSINAILLAIIAKSLLIIFCPYFYVNSSLTYALEIIVFIPLFALVFTALARYCERQADLFSSAVTCKESFISSMNILKLLIGTKPKWFPKWLLTHPEIEDRIENVNNTSELKITKLIRDSKVLRYLLAVFAVILIFMSVYPVTIVLNWSNLYNAAQAGNCRLVSELCNSLPEWLKEHPFVLEQRSIAAMNCGNYGIAAVVAFKAYFGVDLGSVLQIPHHSGSPEVAFDFKVMQLVLKFLNFN